MHFGTWGLAAIVIVVVSWLMYRYLAPASWKEWERAGVGQALIIAFYAEMNGFPLTTGPRLSTRRAAPSASTVS